MGDSFEFVTRGVDPIPHFKVSSNAIRFKVKGSTNAVVQLGRKPGHSDYTIIIGDRNRFSFIQRNPGSSFEKIPTLFILSDNQYKGFWISWHNSVSLGQDGETLPLLTVASKSTNITSYIKYVWFECNHPSPNTLFWIVELPPKLPTVLSTRKITSGKLEWKQVDESLPDGALIGGYEFETLYIIRAKHQRSLTPGKFVPSEGEGYIPWGGQALPGDNPEVLCGFNCIWVPTSGNDIPLGAVLGGYSEVGQERLYVGRANHDGHLIPGKVQPSHKCCYIPYASTEVCKRVYEILVDPNHGSRVVDSFKPHVPEYVSEGPPSPSSPQSDESEPESDYDDYNADDDNMVAL